MSDICEQAIRALLNTTTYGRTLIVEQELPSTNLTARELAKNGAPEGTVVIAVKQSGGRGTKGRTFHSPEGGVYLSIILRPNEKDAPLITSCAAVAVARAIERLCTLTARIKWVNDLYIGKKKVCGILTEAGFSADNALDYVILGIGINVAPTVFPSELSAIATSLGNEGAVIDRNELIAALLTQWETTYATIGSRAFLSESRQRSCVLGNTITVTRGDDRFTARAVDITDDGHLIVQKDNGERVALCSGEVSIQV